MCQEPPIIARAKYTTLGRILRDLKKVQVQRPKEVAHTHVCMYQLIVSPTDWT
jgi:hypothetical protein